MKTEREKTVSKARCVTRDACSVFRIPYSVTPRSAIRNTEHATRFRAFTLLELLVVVAIMAIVMTIGIPFMKSAVDNPTGMKGAYKALDEACRDARAHAVLQQTTTELRITSEGAIDISVVGNTSSQRSSPTGEFAEEPGQVASNKPIGQSGGPRKLPEDVGIEAILANGLDVTDIGEARIRFRANGTCDEFRLVLYHPESGQKRMAWLDVVTATLDFETDEYKFKLQ